MTIQDPNAPNAMSPDVGGDRPPEPHRVRSAMFIILVAAAAALMGAFASHAYSQGFRFGPPWHGHGFLENADPAFIEDRADRMIRHVAIEVDATAEQQERLRSIVRSAVRDLLPLREKAMSARQRGRELLTQTTIDRAAIETFRAEQLALADQASRRFAQALADAAAVLTPEQRRKIAEHAAAMRGYKHRWYRG